MDSFWLSHLEGIAASLAFFVLLWELNRNLRQRRYEAVMTIYAANRELIQMALDDPDLMAVLNGQEDVDTAKERRYVQLWVNHMEMIHQGWRKSFLTRSSWRSLERDNRLLCGPFG